MSKNLSAKYYQENKNKKKLVKDDVLLMKNI